MLVVLRALQPLVGPWWPAARVFTLLADGVTAALVGWIGRELYGRRGGLTAGLIYGANPLALVSGVRVGQDSLITVLGMAGLALLVTMHSRSRGHFGMKGRWAGLLWRQAEGRSDGKRRYGF